MAVVVTAVVVFAVVATSGAIAGLSMFAILGKTKLVLLAGIKFQSFSASGALGTAAFAGIKNAEKNWSKPWQGWGEAFMAFKLKYNFCSVC